MTWEQLNDAPSVTWRLKTPNGWLVISNGHPTYVEDKEHSWSIDGYVPPAVPPVPPVPTKIVVFDDKVQNQFVDYSWAIVDTKYAVEKYAGANCLKADVSNWAAVNFYKEAGFSTTDYEGVEFRIKSLGTGSEKVAVVFNANYTDIAQVDIAGTFADKKIPTADWGFVKVSFDTMGLKPGNTFTNLLFKGTTSATQAPFLLDEVYLLKRAVPATIPMPAPDPNPAPATSGWLKIVGNKIVDANGNTIKLRGCNLPDTRSNNACAYQQANVDELKRRATELITGWKANLIRFTLECYASAGGRVQWASIVDDDKYFQDVKAAVSHMTSLGAYVIITPWVDPSFDSLGAPTDATLPTIHKLASAFRNDAHVLFGFCNEPQFNFNDAKSPAIAAMYEKCIKVVRDVEAQFGTPAHICVAAAPQGWARKLDYFIAHPLTDKMVIYDTHVYNPQIDFADLVSKPHQTLPIVIGEYGPFNDSSGSMSMADCQNLIDLADSLSIPWIAWSFHHKNPPNLLKSNSTGCGENMVLEVSTDGWGQLVKTAISA